MTTLSAGIPDIYDLPLSAQQLAQTLGKDVSELVKVDANENPYGPPPGALQAVARAAVNRYPDADGTEVREALGAYLGCSPESIVLGNGSDELIDLICRAALVPGDEVVITPPTFGVYALVARQAGARVVDVVRSEEQGFSLPMDGLLRAVSERAKLIFLCAPNNPTGDPIAESDLRAILELGPLVVLDEAYSEFAERGYVHLAQEYSNLVVLRTFSKAFGLAGLRVGYGVCPPAVAARLAQLKLPYNVNGPAQAAALAALRDTDWVQRHLDLIRAERERLLEALRALRGAEPLPSATNFVLVHITEKGAGEVYRELLKRGIMVRCFRQPPLDRYLRITVGTPEQNSAVLEALETILSERGN